MRLVVHAGTVLVLAGCSLSEEQPASKAPLPGAGARSGIAG